MGLLLLGLSLGVYFPVLRGGMLWDDDAHVTKPALQSLGGLWRIWSSLHATQQYYPLLHSAFWVEHRLWGDSTLGYHLLNVGLHALSALLFYRLLRRLGIAGAGLSAALFTVHPVCVESVAWISEQKNTLSLAFYLLSAHAYLSFDRGRRPRDYAAALLLFACALLTKSVTATLPAALLVILWLERGRLSLRRDAAPLVPWFALGIAGGMLTSWVERSLIGAAGPEFALSFTERLLLAGRVTGFYLGKLLWPLDLMFIYPHWDARRDAASWAPWLVGSLLLTALLWALRRRSRGPLSAWLLFVGSLFPALGFFNVYPFIFSYVADHFQYLPSLAVFAAAGAGASWLLARLPAGLRGTAHVLAGLLVATLALESSGLSRTYSDEPTLYTRTLELNPACWMAHNNLGLWYEGHGDPQKALLEYEAAIRIKPDYSAAHSNLGSLLRNFPGRGDDALAHIQEALRIEPDSPVAHNNLGTLYQDRGDLDDAVIQYREAVRLNHAYAAAYDNLAGILEKQPGHEAEAMECVQAALRFDPGLADAHNNLATLLSGMAGRTQDAIAEYRTAIRLMPGFAQARNNLGNLLAKDPATRAEAIGQYEESLRLAPDSPETHNNLGAALVAEGRVSEAVDQYNEALRLRPDLSEIHFNIAMAILNVPGRRAEAAEHLAIFLRAHPENETAARILAQITQPVP
jgi:tetratricopeptide (TPR) repeat protein